MTLQHRFLVGLGDIKAVTFECTACGASLSVLPDKIEMTTLQSCAACQTPWLQSREAFRPVEKAGLTQLLDSLADARKEQQRENIKLRVLFEFDLPK